MNNQNKTPDWNSSLDELASEEMLAALQLDRNEAHRLRAETETARELQADILALLVEQTPHMTTEKLKMLKIFIERALQLTGGVL
jgi:hypothetical protein